MRKLFGTILLYLPIIIGIILVLFFTHARKNKLFDNGQATMITSATLTDAIDISELSTAQYTYNGIAEIYKDE